MPSTIASIHANQPVLIQSHDRKRIYENAHRFQYGSALRYIIPFVYWDNSNILHEAQRCADERDEGPGARYRVRINFDNLLGLAHAGRPLKKAVGAGTVPPELRQLWNRIENQGVDVCLVAGRNPLRGEADRPDGILQRRMLEDALDYAGDPGIAVFVTGDGTGYRDGTGVQSALERMREWAERKGVFVALEDFYDAITFMEPSRPGHEFAPSRRSASLDLSERPMAPRTIR